MINHNGSYQISACTTRPPRRLSLDPDSIEAFDIHAEPKRINSSGLFSHASLYWHIQRARKDYSTWWWSILIWLLHCCSKTDSRLCCKQTKATTLQSIFHWSSSQRCFYLFIFFMMASLGEIEPTVRARQDSPGAGGQDTHFERGQGFHAGIDNQHMTLITRLKRTHASLCCLVMLHVSFSHRTSWSLCWTSPTSRWSSTGRSRPTRRRSPISRSCCRRTLCTSGPKYPRPPP